MIFDKKSAGGQKMLLSAVLKNWRKDTMEEKENKAKANNLDKLQTMFGNRAAANRTAFMKDVFRILQDFLAVGNDPWSLLNKIYRIEEEKKEVDLEVVELTADMERQQELWAEAKERADAAEHACNEWTAKTAKVQELSAVLQTQVGMMQHEARKLRNAVQEERDKVQRRDQEKRSLMQSLESVHSETQNQEYGLMRSAIANSLYLKSTNAFPPGLEEPKGKTAEAHSPDAAAGGRPAESVQHGPAIASGPFGFGAQLGPA